jgi:hypothetical protein
VRRITYTGAALGVLLALWLGHGAYRGRTAGTTTPALFAAALIVAACLLTLAVGLVLMEHRPPVRKAPR